MGIQIDERRQVQQKKFDDALVAAVEFELEGAVGHSGGELTGLSVRFSSVDCLLTLRAVLPAGKMVSFVGGATLADCFRRHSMAAIGRVKPLCVSLGEGAVWHKSASNEGLQPSLPLMWLATRG